MRYIDLRSDTVTQPTDDMRKAMAAAPVGDDVYGDDPTMNKLEEMAAAIVGKEAALFVPSGTFGNQCALLTHTKRGDEVILGRQCHIIQHEVGAASVIAGVQTYCLNAPLGQMDLKEVEEAVRGENIHYPRTGLICIENAHSSGAVLPLDYLQKLYALAKKYDLPVHMDGARLFNAALASGADVKEITACCDSVMFCLSKGLAAPVGSILAGSKEFVDRARKSRKIMGGGMRQAGILAAAGILAITDMVKRLPEDHENAVYMAEELAAIPGVTVAMDKKDINMVYFTIEEGMADSDKLVDYFYNNGVKINGIEGGEYRFVTHVDVKKEDVKTAVGLLKEALASGAVK